ncbi:MAG: fused MFS/spermidine synthase [Candidatus Riflebacteria bacterium]|nr:fused MFS/spermidine synthase [Candidatus Riflebacteria bacterium]
MEQIDFWYDIFTINAGGDFTISVSTTEVPTKAPGDLHSDTVPEPSRSLTLKHLLFGVSSFLASFLFFWAQPMAGKQLLPIFGGASSVWAACLVFFQAMLLGGYLLAHLGVGYLTAFRHSLVHSLLLIVSLGLMCESHCNNGIAVSDWLATIGLPPAIHVFLLLFMTFGAPMLLIGASSPALQSWFVYACMGRRDPYGLYAAGNTGSLLALIAFPFFIEPSMDLALQTRVWFWCVAFLAILFVLCALVLRSTPMKTCEASSCVNGIFDELGGSARLRRIGLAFLPAALLNAVTNTITTDLAPIPLFWVIPLGLYLLSFILVFSRAAPPATIPGGVISAILLTPALTLFDGSISWPLHFAVAYHLIIAGLIFLLFHGALARERPASSGLTAYYLDLSIGGLLGGLFVALLAPLLFCEQPEHALLIAVAALCLDTVAPESEVDGCNPASSAKETGYPGNILNILIFQGGKLRFRKMVAIFLALLIAVIFQRHARVSIITSVSAITMTAFFSFAMIIFSFISRRLFGGLLASSLCFCVISSAWVGPKLFAGRNFYGTCRVESFSDNLSARLLFHGNICHGAQITDPGLRRLPLTYFSIGSPIGRLIRKLQFQRRSLEIAVVGLGAGSLAAYARMADEIIFYEIDPKIIHLARDSGLFSFVSDCRGKLQIVEGDGRLSLSRDDPGKFNLIVLDAYSSDSIPIHLLTREALELYLSLLAPGGVIAFHISNRYINLVPPIAAIAHALNLNGQEDFDDPDMFPHPYDLENRLIFASHWVVLYKPAVKIQGLFSDISWKHLPPANGFPVWTDRQSAIGSLFTAK